MPANNKRRKLDIAPAPPVSAFAARRNLREESIISQMVINDDTLDDLSATQNLEVEIQETLDLSSPSSPFSRAASPEDLSETPALIFSTFKANLNNPKELQNGEVALKLAPGERVIVFGEYDISVQKGKVAILHTTIQPSKRRYRVYAPSSHSLPVIRCLVTDVDDAEISLYHVESGLRTLETLSPLFGKMWNNEALGEKTSYLKRQRRDSSFLILESTQDPKNYIQPIISPVTWNELLAKVSVPDPQRPVVTLICGPKSSGKSTFAKLVTNRILSGSMNESGKNQPGVAILDIDPGQPEYSTPGQLSLFHVKDPNFGPPFSHPVASSRNRTIRSHTIGAITPAQDPDHYISCVLDLFSHYHSLLSHVPRCPLVINTPGWVLGTGLEILVRLITRIRPTNVIYMSTDGPAEVVKDLQGAATDQTFYTLPSQASEYTTRTAAHLRTMQTMSYFHSESTSNGSLKWNGLPLTDVPPWELNYSKDAGSLLGVMCYGEQPPAELLIDAINGSLVALVLIEDTAAIPGWDTQTCTNSEYHYPLIIHTPTSNIPYFNPLNALTLLPQYSSSIGLALIRSIDITRQRLQLLTPIAPSVIEALNEQGRKLVLVSGKFDTPGWAYTEGMGESAGAGEKEVEVEVPWVEKLQGSRGRGTGAKVWRVRRDLGKGDGGE